MKKLLSIVLSVAVMLIAFTACTSAQSGNAVAAPTTQPTATIAQPEATAPQPTQHVHTVEIIPAEDATCINYGKTEGKRCSECGEILVEQEWTPSLGHTTETGTCERCGQNFGIWEVGYYVDEFNQPTSNWYICNSKVFSGTFNNSAVTGEKLTAEIVVDCEGDITLFLYTYGRSLVKNSSQRYVDDFDIKMRASNGEVYDMKGTIYCGEDRIFIKDKYKSIVLDALLGEGEFSFSIVKSDRTIEKYVFTAQASNFKEVYEKMS